MRNQDESSKFGKNDIKKGIKSKNLWYNKINYKSDISEGIIRLYNTSAINKSIIGLLTCLYEFIMARKFKEVQEILIVLFPLYKKYKKAIIDGLIFLLDNCEDIKNRNKFLSIIDSIFADQKKARIGIFITLIQWKVSSPEKIFEALETLERYINLIPYVQIPYFYALHALISYKVKSNRSLKELEKYVGMYKKPWTINLCKPRYVRLHLATLVAYCKVLSDINHIQVESKIHKFENRSTTFWSFKICLLLKRIYLDYKLNLEDAIKYISYEPICSNEIWYIFENYIFENYQGNPSQISIKNKIIHLDLIVLKILNSKSLNIDSLYSLIFLMFMVAKNIFCSPDFMTSSFTKWKIYYFSLRNGLFSKKNLLNHKKNLDKLNSLYLKCPKTLE